MPHNLMYYLEASLLLFGSNQGLDGNTVIDLIIGVFEEEGVLIMNVSGEVANGFDAEYLDFHMVGGVVLIEQILILAILIDQVDLALIIEPFIEMFH